MSDFGDRENLGEIQVDLLGPGFDEILAGVEEVLLGWEPGQTGENRRELFVEEVEFGISGDQNQTGGFSLG